MSVSELNVLLEKTTNWDKDERYMATSDLCNELQKDIKIDVNMEKRICSSILKQLDDQSNDVQSIAVKCLGILIKKVQEQQILEICEKLCRQILEGKRELRDIYSIGLKTLISDVPETMGKTVAVKLTPMLLEGIDPREPKPPNPSAKDESLEIKLECLDNLTEMLKRFGREVEPEHEKIREAVSKQLGHEKQIMRKRANACLGAFATVVSDPLLNRLMEDLLHHIEGQTKGKDVQTLIQTVGTISRMVGYRLGKHLDRVVPLFLRFCGNPEDENTHSEECDELRETCFAAFESVVLRCPREVSSHLEAIIAVSLTFMKYDPNYQFDYDEEGEEQDEEYEDEDFGGSDDDDTSWKVRRSALRVLSAVITSRPELLYDLYEKSCDELINRFKEREENVRLDVLQCFTRLLKATLAVEALGKGPVAGTAGLGLRSAQKGEIFPRDDALIKAESFEIYRTDSVETEVSREDSMEIETDESRVLSFLRAKVPNIIKAADKQLRGKDQKTKTAVLTMLKSLATVLHGGLSDQIDVVMTDIEKCLKDKSQALKLEALKLLRTILETHPSSVIYSHLQSMVPLVTACVRDDWYKIIAEALRVVGVIVTIIRPLDRKTKKFVAGGVDPSGFVPTLYEAIYQRLEANDIDQEIKECAIFSMGRLIRYLGDHLTAKLPDVLNLLREKLKNEITRMPTLKALASIATSPLNIDLSTVLSSAVTELSQFLRQQSRPLKLTTLGTLISLIRSNPLQMSPDLYTQVLSEASNLISPSDLHLSHLSLQLTRVILTVLPTSLQTIDQYIMPKVLELAKSPLLQGFALKSVLGLLEELVKKEDSASVKRLTQKLQAIALDQSQGTIPKQVIGNVAVCIASISNQSVEGDKAAFLRQLVQDIRSEDDGIRHLALLCIGELGQKQDLSSVPDLHSFILASFSNGNEETKTAAAYALGHVTLGNMPKYLPSILEYLEDPARPQYLLLSALKEVIIIHSVRRDSDFLQYVGQVLPHLFRHAKSPEEGVRNMVAECLGTLANINPLQVFEALTKLREEAMEDIFVKWTIATALRFSISSSFHGPGSAASYLAEDNKLLLKILEDSLEEIKADVVTNEELDVQRATLLTINAAAHHQPRVVIPLLSRHIVPVIIKCMDLYNLKRTVNLGPFKHTVDDGLPLRKAAFSCLDTMLETIPEFLDVGSFMPYLIQALSKDKDDVQMLCHQILVKICKSKHQSFAVLNHLDQLIDPLENQANKKARDGQVATEVERANDVVRSALRAIVALYRIDGASTSPTKLLELVNRIQSKDNLRETWQGIVAERVE